MAERAFVTIKGAKQGTFAGDGRGGKKKDRIEILSFEFELQSPRDPATGQASGKRQWKPIVITKEWGAATLQILTALATNEVLTSVLFEFTGTTPRGLEQLDHSIKLTDASILDYRDTTQSVPPPGGTHLLALDQVSFTFRRIEVSDKSGKTFVDDWQTTA
jgi:type VI secretion system secreted protein Hcp